MFSDFIFFSVGSFSIEVLWAGIIARELIGILVDVDHKGGLDEDLLGDTSILCEDETVALLFFRRKQFVICIYMIYTILDKKVSCLVFCFFIIVDYLMDGYNIMCRHGS